MFYPFKNIFASINYSEKQNDGTTKKSSMVRQWVAAHRLRNTVIESFNCNYLSLNVDLAPYSCFNSEILILFNLYLRVSNFRLQFAFVINSELSF